MYSVDLVYRLPIYYIDDQDRFQYIEIDHYEQLTKRIGLINQISYYQLNMKQKQAKKIATKQK